MALRPSSVVLQKFPGLLDGPVWQKALQWFPQPAGIAAFLIHYLLLASFLRKSLSCKKATRNPSQHNTALASDWPPLSRWKSRSIPQRQGLVYGPLRSSCLRRPGCFCVPQMPWFHWLLSALYFGDQHTTMPPVHCKIKQNKPTSQPSLPGLLDPLLLTCLAGHKLCLVFHFTVISFPFLPLSPRLPSPWEARQQAWIPPSISNLPQRPLTIFSSSFSWNSEACPMATPSASLAVPASLLSPQGRCYWPLMSASLKTLLADSFNYCCLSLRNVNLIFGLETLWRDAVSF